MDHIVEFEDTKKTSKIQISKSSGDCIHRKKPLFSYLHVPYSNSGKLTSTELPFLLSYKSSSFVSCRMENRIYYRLGGKSYDLTETKSTFGILYEWVESAKLYMRRMTLSRGALVWLCRRLKEAADFKGKSFESWRRRDPSTYIYCSLKFNKYCIFISIIAVNGESKLVSILPKKRI